jgi:hypothetical protein
MPRGKSNKMIMSKACSFGASPKVILICFEYAPLISGARSLSRMSLDGNCVQRKGERYQVQTVVASRQKALSSFQV